MNNFSFNDRMEGVQAGGWLFMIVIILFIAFVWRMFLRVSSLSDLQSDVSGQWLRGKVVYVNDGDLFRFFHVPWVRSSEHHGEPTLNVRLAGIDAPERFQPFSYESKKKLKELVLNKTVNLKLLKVDQDDRILAICYNTFLKGVFNTTNVNTKMVELGLASVYRGRDAVYDDYKDDLLRLQAEAKERKIGVWSLKNYESPKQFRKDLWDRIERERNERERNENCCTCM